eukprot:PhF_6_TR24948/c1_g1_i1/m.34335
MDDEIPSLMLRILVACETKIRRTTEDFYIKPKVVSFFHQTSGIHPEEYEEANKSLDKIATKLNAACKSRLKATIGQSTVVCDVPFMVEALTSLMVRRGHIIPDKLEKPAWLQNVTQDLITKYGEVLTEKCVEEWLRLFWCDYGLKDELPEAVIVAKKESSKEKNEEDEEKERKGILDAIDQKNVDDLKNLLSKAKQKRSELKILIKFLDECFGSDRSNALYKASREGSLECVKALVSHNASVNLEFPRHAQKWGSSALHVAVSKLHLPVVSYLCRKGAHIAAKNQRGDTPLMEALIRQASPIQYNGDVSKNILPITPLHGAMVYLMLKNTVPDNDASELRQLCQKSTLIPSETTNMKSEISGFNLDEVTEINYTRWKSGWNLIHAACAYGNSAALDILLYEKLKTPDERKHAVVIQDSHGWT